MTTDVTVFKFSPESIVLLFRGDSLQTLIDNDDYAQKLKIKLDHKAVYSMIVREMYVSNFDPMNITCLATLTKLKVGCEEKIEAKFEQDVIKDYIDFMSVWELEHRKELQDLLIEGQSKKAIHNLFALLPEAHLRE